VRRATSTLVVSLVVLGAAGACTLTTSLEGYAGPELTTPDASSDGGGDAAADGPPLVESGADAGYRELVLADSPLAYYRLDDPGTVAKDEVGAHDGTYKGAVAHTKGALTGDGDRAAVFDGSSYVDVGDVLPFLGTEPFSIEAWAAPNDHTGDPYCIAAKNIPDDAGALVDGYTMFIDDPKLTLLMSRWRGASDDTATGPDLSPKVFRHLVATYDGQTIALYVDGQRAAQQPSTRALTIVPRPLTLGASRGGTYCFFRGALDEIAIYGVALTEDRIRAHYAAAK
jgi:Concanavalin A-like lectin/glucanases superfamily